MAEMEGFEPPHALRRLADFESAPFSHLGTSPLGDIITVWNQKIKVSGISLYIGLAPYKIGLTDTWAGNGKNEWINDSAILARQVQSARDYKKYGGFALFRYASLFNPDSSVKSQVEKEKNALADVL